MTNLVIFGQTFCQGGATFPISILLLLFNDIVLETKSFPRAVHCTAQLVYSAIEG